MGSLASVMVIIAVDEEVFDYFHGTIRAAAPSILPSDPNREGPHDDDEPNLSSGRKTKKQEAQHEPSGTLHKEIPFPAEPVLMGCTSALRPAGRDSISAAVPLHRSSVELCRSVRPSAIF